MHERRKREYEHVDERPNRLPGSRSGCGPAWSPWRCIVLLGFVVPAVVPEVQHRRRSGRFARRGWSILVWWLFFSRAPWSERLGALVLMVVALLATSRLVHVSIADRADGDAVALLCALPVLSLALVAWAVASRRLARRTSARDAGRGHPARVRGVHARADRRHHRRRRSGSPLAVDADSRGAAPGPGRRAGAAPARRRDDSRRAPRPGRPARRRRLRRPRRRKLRRAAARPGRRQAARRFAPAPAPRQTGADWPGFRGPERDGVVRGVRIETDWAASPPVELWRRPIGPGWSSFAVRGDLLYTQEQRGDDEVVACYNAGHRRAGVEAQRRGPVLGVERRRRSARHADPQQRPRLHLRRHRDPERARRRRRRRRVVAQRGGRHRSQRSRTGASPARRWWSATSSSSPPPAQLAAYDVATGEPRWLGPAGGGGYSSPHLVTIGGVAAGPAARGAGVDQRRAGRRQAALGAPRGAERPASCSRPWPRTATS